MSVRHVVVIALLWLSSLVLVAATARGQARPQAPEPRVDVQVVPGREATVLSGGDIGFRLEGWQRDTPVGRLVIRLNGQWVEPAETKKPVFVTR